MKLRLLTAAVALPILIASIVLPSYFPPTVWLFVALGVVAIGAGLFEFYSITKKMQLKADAAVGYTAASALTAAFAIDAPAEAPDLIVLVLVGFAIVLLATQAFRFRADFTKLLVGAGVTAVGVLFVPLLGGFLIATRVGFENRPYLSTHLLAYFFLVLMSSDAGAYFAGRALGKHKLAPSISPGKTWEGLAGGLAAAAAAAALSSLWFFRELPIHISIVLALVLAALGVVGDLAESAIKRGAGVKDTASILPGHGGFLDRLDSLLFAAPILYYFARFYF